MIENTSGFEPSGVAVLLQPYDPSMKKSAIEIPAHVQAQVDTRNTRAVVIALGPLVWMEEKDEAGRRVMRANVGDKVLVTNMAGTMVIGPADGKQYRMVNDRDIFCRIVKES